MRRNNPALRPTRAEVSIARHIQSKLPTTKDLLLLFLPVSDCFRTNRHRHAHNMRQPDYRATPVPPKPSATHIPTIPHTATATPPQAVVPRRTATATRAIPRPRALGSFLLQYSYSKRVAPPIASQTSQPFITFLQHRAYGTPSSDLTGRPNSPFTKVRSALDRLIK